MKQALAEGLARIRNDVAEADLDPEIAAEIENGLDSLDELLGRPGDLKVMYYLHSR